MKKNVSCSVIILFYGFMFFDTIFTIFFDINLGDGKNGTFLLILNYKSIGFSSGSGFLRIDRFFFLGRVKSVKIGGKLGLVAFITIPRRRNFCKIFYTETHVENSSLSIFEPCSSLQTNNFPAHSKKLHVYSLLIY
jgi:hypothetical protein